MSHDLRDEMLAAAERVEIPPGDVGAVTERGRETIRRRRGVMAIALVLVVGVSAVGGWAQLFGAEGNRRDRGPSHPSEIGKRVELASGQIAGWDWRAVEWISLNPDLCTRLVINGVAASICTAGTAQSSGHEIQALKKLAVSGGRRSASAVFGIVSPEVAELTVELEDGDTVQARLLPSGFPEYEGVSHFLAFVSDDAGTVIAKDADGLTLAHEDFKIDRVWGVSPRVIRTPRSD